MRVRRGGAYQMNVIPALALSLCLLLSACGDAPDFRPTLTFFPVSEGTDGKGAVLICAGRAFQDGGKQK